MITVKFKKLDKRAMIPQYQTEGSAGFDIHALNDGLIFGHANVDSSDDRRAIVSTGLSVEIPQGYELQIRSRSGLALKNGVTVLNSPGTIDSDYRGEIKIILINDGYEDLNIKAGDRIAQGVIAIVPKVIIEETTEELSDTLRGTGGFGSTNK